MTRCIFLAAGSGTRLRPYTENIPKCLIPFRGLPLLSHLIDVATTSGISDIVIIRGFLRDKVNVKGVKYIDNPDGFNMLHSLFCADEELNGEVVVSYTDILYEPAVMEELLNAASDISVVVDMAWEEYYRARADDPFSIAESLVMNDGKILEIGKPVKDTASVQSQYIGLMKFTGRGIEQLRDCYWKNRRLSWGQPWQQAQRFELAYMTDILQALIDSGIEVSAVPIEHGWLEFDTASDYERAVKWDEEGTLSRFIHLQKQKLT
jgi:choline kinase